MELISDTNWTLATNIALKRGDVVKCNLVLPEVFEPVSPSETVLTVVFLCHLNILKYLKILQSLYRYVNSMFYEHR